MFSLSIFPAANIKSNCITSKYFVLKKTSYVCIFFKRLTFNILQKLRKKKVTIRVKTKISFLTFASKICCFFRLLVQFC